MNTITDKLATTPQNYRLGYRREDYSNDAACEYVVARAQAGDPLHIKALSTLAKRRLINGDQ